jgi:RHS repeat-associated protein
MKNIKQLVLLFLAIAMSLSELKAQIPNKTMPTPTAAALGKYSDIPVNLSTGVPSISIPIHTLSEGALSLPISLSYHASGVKVAEVASNVGLGWSLNAGGSISRAVLDKPDESENGYLATGKNLTTISAYSPTSADKEPDLFTFNFNGYTGKFFIDKDNVPRLVPMQDIKVEFTFTTAGYQIEKFILTTSDGNRYIFGKDIERNMEARERPYGTTIFNAWHLLKIETYDKSNQILFTYNDVESYSYYSKPTNYLYIPKFTGPISTSTATCVAYFTTPSVTSITLTPIRTSIHNARLEKIETSTEIVNFLFEKERLDLQQGENNPSGAKRDQLTKIEIKPKIGELVCKQFELEQENLDCDVTTACGEIVPHLSTTKRLRLNKVTEKSCKTNESIVNPPYVIQYEAGKLPYLLSRKVDHWGFSNQVYPLAMNVPCDDPLSIPDRNVNRETNPNAVKIGNIKKITYPTGGYTEFAFEPNTGTIVSNKAQNVVAISNNTSLPASVPAQLGATQMIASNTKFLYTFQPISFTTNQIKYSQYHLKLEPFQGNAVITLFIRNTVSQIVATLSFNAAATSNTSSSSNEILGHLSSLATFTSGQLYTISIELSRNPSPLIVSPNGVFSFNISDPDIKTNQTVGGLRIQKITTCDATTNCNVIEKTYEYTDESNTTISSGLVYNKPRYKFEHSTNNPLVTINISDEIYIDQPIIPLGDYDGYHISYSRVVENFKDNGKKIHRFFEAKRAIDIAGQNISYPQAPATFQEDKGQLSSTTTQNNSSVEIASETKKPSTLLYNQPIFGLAYKAFTIPVSNPDYSSCFVYLRAYIYPLKTYAYRLEESVETIDNVKTTTAYGYNANKKYLMPNKVTTTNSDGKQTVVDTKYWSDVYPYITALQDMEKYNLLLPLESTLSVDGNLVSGTKTEFAVFDNSTGLVNTSNPWNANYTLRPSKFHNYESTWTQATPSATPAFATTGWILKGTINSYHGSTSTLGRPNLVKEFKKPGWEVETYEWTLWGGLKKRTLKDFTWQYDYYTSGTTTTAQTNLIKTITSVDGQTTEYAYDALMRLKSVSARGGNVKADYTYTYPTLTNGVITSPGNVKETKTFTTVAGSNISKQETYSYIDGLGRTIETVNKGAYLPSGLDQISAVAYDNRGQVAKQYELFVGTANTGAYQAPAATAPYTLTEYFADPLHRVNKVTPPGWFATTTAFGSNTAAEAIRNYDFKTGAYTSYADNLLFKTTLTDANGNKTISYKDKKGRLVCSQKAGASAGLVSTYYAYDDKDRLVRVIAPDALWADTKLNFWYEYDAVNRIKQKQVPGKAIEKFQYNVRDLLALYQDGFLNTKWIATNYDLYGRVTNTGIWNGTAATDNEAIPVVENITKNTYNLATSATLKDKLDKSEVMLLDKDPVTNTASANPMLVKTFTYDAYGRVSTTKANSNVNRGWTPSSTTLNPGEKIDYTYDFADNILSEYRLSATTFFPTIGILNSNKFDAWGRLTQIKQKVDNNENTVEYSYNEKNQLLQKKLGVSTVGALQEVDYAYLTNGMLKSINGGTGNYPLGAGTLFDDVIKANPTSINASFGATTTAAQRDLFSMTLHYDTSPTSVTTGAAQKNGNISKIAWQVYGRVPQVNTYTYDFMDRMTESNHWEYNASATTGTPINRDYFTEALTYDNRGNITSLKRKGVYNSSVTSTPTWNKNTLDNLTYTYLASTNHLNNITDAAPVTAGFIPKTGNYMYDSNGNMIYDPNKNLTISYNHLNLPTKFSFAPTKYIEILYDATGTKLRKKVTDGTTVTTQDYLNGMELRNNHLEAVYNAEGRVFNTKVNDVSFYPFSFRFEYNLKDHLGNTRITFCDKDNDKKINGTSEILQENHYYPFGLNLDGPWLKDATATKYRYQYNGKELNEDLGLNMNDYGARWYDATIGRWSAVDPLAENSRRWSPYNYGVNNPVRFIDPDGMQATDWYKSRDGSSVAWKKGDAETIEVKGQTYDNVGEEVTITNIITGDKYYGDETGRITNLLELDEVTITASALPSTGIATIGFGFGATGVFGVGSQSGIDFTWIVRGKDASFLPYVVGSGGGGTGYNIDVDAHIGVSLYSGYQSDLTADNILNTSLSTGEGYTSSFSASEVAEVGVNFSHARATNRTRIVGGSVSVGASVTPGVNWYGGRYISQRVQKK